MNVFVEGYGCSLNKADTEMIKGFLKESHLKISALEKADYAIINTCAVKEPTEFKMLKRIRELFALSKKFGFQLIVFGCLPKISPSKVEKISKSITMLGPSLSGLAEFFQLEKKDFNPSIPQINSNPFVSIIPICRGCLLNCSYCCVKNARGKLKSHSVKELNEKFCKAIKEFPEIWLTAQDTAAYGKDINSSLPGLLKKLLKNKGDFRARIGMMNPMHLKKHYEELLPLLKDERVYKFLHIPVQSGSDKILKLMNRNYSRRDFLELIKRIKKDLPDATISTDVIVGFPDETEDDFNETISLLKEARPSIVNISRYGKRPNTKAAELKQVYGWIKKQRSRKLSKLCKEIGFQNRNALVGRIETVLVSEKGKNNSAVGRTDSYLPVVVPPEHLGQFVKAELVKARPTYFLGRVVE